MRRGHGKRRYHRKIKGIAVSQLAAYAENPAATVGAKGRPYDAQAAQMGERGHQELGRLPARYFFLSLVVSLGVLWIILR